MICRSFFYYEPIKSSLKRTNVVGDSDFRDFTKKSKDDNPRKKILLKATSWLCHHLCLASLSYFDFDPSWAYNN